MEAQAGTPFFSEISSPFPDTVSVFPATVNTAGNQAARPLPQRIVLHPNAHPATLLPLCPKNPVPALSLYQNFPPRYLINSTNPRLYEEIPFLYKSQPTTISGALYKKYSNIICFFLFT